MLKVGFCRIFHSRFSPIFHRFTVSLNSRFQKMNSNSCSEKESPMKKFKDEQDEEPKVFVLSRITILAHTLGMLEFEVETSPKIDVINIDVPENSNIIEPHLLRDVEILICDPVLLSCNYQNMPRLKWAHCTWAGVESLFQSITEKPDFIVTKHSYKDFSNQMAEYVMMQVLINERNYRHMWAAEARKSWSDMKRIPVNAARLLDELTIGVLGVGNMGKAIAKFFKSRGAKIIGFAKTPRARTEFGSFDSIEVSLSNVIPQSHYLINTLPSTPETIGLLDGNVLQNTSKEGCCFINVGRADIVQESTLLRALQESWLTHIVLDVFEQEPLPRESPLWYDPRITITPHCAAISKPTSISFDFAENLKRYQQHLPLENEVNWSKRY